VAKFGVPKPIGDRSHLRIVSLGRLSSFVDELQWKVKRAVLEIRFDCGRQDLSMSSSFREFRTARDPNYDSQHDQEAVLGSSLKRRESRTQW
jgi:hypothetical protein